jgi:hypothetical protein
MKRNVGGVDKVLRVGVGIALLFQVVPVAGSANWWGLIGVVPLATALFRYCPLYSPFGFDTSTGDKLG